MTTQPDLHSSWFYTSHIQRKDKVTVRNSTKVHTIIMIIHNNATLEREVTLFSWSCPSSFIVCAVCVCVESFNFSLPCLPLLCSSPARCSLHTCAASPSLARPCSWHCPTHYPSPVFLRFSPPAARPLVGWFALKSSLQFIRCVCLILALPLILDNTTSSTSCLPPVFGVHFIGSSVTFVST